MFDWTGLSLTDSIRVLGLLFVPHPRTLAPCCLHWRTLTADHITASQYTDKQRTGRVRNVADVSP